MIHTCIVYDDHGGELRLTGGGYAVRCAAAIAGENWPDARWALEVLNKYGHLVRHPADAYTPPPCDVEVA